MVVDLTITKSPSLLDKISNCHLTGREENMGGRGDHTLKDFSYSDTIVSCSPMHMVNSVFPKDG